MPRNSMFYNRTIGMVNIEQHEKNIISYYFQWLNIPD